MNIVPHLMGYQSVVKCSDFFHLFWNLNAYLITLHFNRHEVGFQENTHKEEINNGGKQSLKLQLETYSACNLLKYHYNYAIEYRSVPCSK